MDNSFGSLEITPTEVKQHLDSGVEFLLVDVREPWEHKTAHIEGAILIPLREIPGSLQRLAGASAIVFFCHHGMRSLDAAAWVQSQGIKGARSMSGGIERWATEVDPSVPRY